MNTPSHTRTAKRAALVGILFFLVCVVTAWLARSPRVAPATAGAPPPPSLIYTQFVAGGPLVVASQGPGGSLVVVTQFDVPTFTVQLPSRFYNAEGRRVSEAEFYSQTRRPDD